MRFKRGFTRLSQKGAMLEGGITHQTEGEHEGERAVLHNPCAEQNGRSTVSKGMMPAGQGSV